MLLLFLLVSCCMWCPLVLLKMLMMKLMKVRGRC